MDTDSLWRRGHVLTRHSAHGLVLVLVLVLSTLTGTLGACASPASVAAPDSKTLVAPPIAPSAEPTLKSPRPVAPECHATLASRQAADRAGRRPADWVRGGTVVVGMVEGRPVRIEARDLDGKTAVRGVRTLPPSTTKAELQDAIRAEACGIGGISVISEASPPASGSFALSVWSPVAPNKETDLGILCDVAPRTIGEHSRYEPSQARALALEAYDVLLTSATWRGFVWSFRRDLAASDGKGHALVLEAAASRLRAERPQCWFAGLLESH